MGDYGIKISKDGYDVKTCTDKQLVMSSEFNHIKIAAEGNGSEVIASLGNATVTVVISTAYMGYMGFYNDPVGNVWYQLVSNGRSTSAGNVWGRSYIDGTDLVIRLFNNTGSQQTVKYKYFLFIEQG